MYIDWSRVANKYPDAAKNLDATQGNNYWIPGAENELNSRLAVRYSVPFSPCPDMISDLVVDMVYWKLTYRNENQDKLKKYIDERLAGLADGTIAIVTSAGVVTDTSNFASVSNSYHTSFGPDEPENWNVDPNWVEDVQDSRA